MGNSKIVAIISKGLAAGEHFIFISAEGEILTLSNKNGLLTESDSMIDFETIVESVR